ncbi:MAG: orotidine-5'-phosphate decarboxylase [Clostridiales Family XIII bacterium]|jgi:orotidine-5'-phosphate decarboxylase|nr:orotidine-5'-phosphate decarboxylase [Clostridiales Family XIII bacterium]
MIDRLTERIEQLNNPAVVGLDPTLEMMPSGLRREMYERFGRTPKAVGEMFAAFNRTIVDSVSDIVPAVKPQIAMYERYGLDGVSAYLRTTDYAAARGLLVIGDVKRGDIASTAEAYAAHLAGVEVEGERFDPWKEDAVTIHPYLGADSVMPFVDACKNFGKAVFVLIKTSNAGSGDIQDLRTAGDAPVYARVARLVSEWGRDCIGTRGYSRVGAVVGATHKETGAYLRSLLPHTFFLVPGYGAQGAGAEDVRGFFDAAGGGAVVNSSRGITAAWLKRATGSGGGDSVSLRDVGQAARDAAIEMRDRLREVIA